MNCSDLHLGLKSHMLCKSEHGVNWRAFYSTVFSLRKQASSDVSGVACIHSSVQNVHNPPWSSKHSRIVRPHSCPGNRHSHMWTTKHSSCPCLTPSYRSGSTQPHLESLDLWAGESSCWVQERKMVWHICQDNTVCGCGLVSGWDVWDHQNSDRFPWFAVSLVVWLFTTTWPDTIPVDRRDLLIKAWFNSVFKRCLTSSKIS